MRHAFEEYCKQLDKHQDAVCAASKRFREALGLTAFAYVRVYHDGRVGWLTSVADHDRFLLEKGGIEEDPLIDTAKLLQEGHYLWFHDRQFRGCESFYRDRKKFFHLDHGLVVVNHKKDYLETGCFSGCLSKKPLYNLFMREKGLFSAFLNHFSSHLSRSLSSHFEESVQISDIKPNPKSPSEELSDEKRKQLIAISNPEFLRLSEREKECLALIGKNHTYKEIAYLLKISNRTVEHYMLSVKNKLAIHTRPELFRAAERLLSLGI